MPHFGFDLLQHWLDGLPNLPSLELFFEHLPLVPANFLGPLQPFGLPPGLHYRQEKLPFESLV